MERVSPLEKQRENQSIQDNTTYMPYFFPREETGTNATIDCGTHGGSKPDLLLRLRPVTHEWPLRGRLQKAVEGARVQIRGHSMDRHRQGIWATRSGDYPGSNIDAANSPPIAGGETVNTDSQDHDNPPVDQAEARHDSPCNRRPIINIRSLNL